MNWWQDKFSIELRVRELKKLWAYILCILLLLLIIINCLLIQIGNIDFQIVWLQKIIGSFILPTLLTIFIGLVGITFKKWSKNSEWAEQEVSIYRDIIESFTRILVSFHRDFGNPFEPPTLRGFYDINMLKDSLNNLRVFVNNREPFLNKNYKALNISNLIYRLSVQYNSILINHCTNSTIKLYYTILVTHLIKIDESINSLQIIEIERQARDDIYNQLNNLIETLPFLYNIIFPIVENVMEVKDMTHDANTYNSLMFESITENPERQKELKTNALMQAWETRNFEINLYWKRAAYFWAFNTTIAIAFFHVTTNTTIDNMWYSAILLILGIACSLAWFLSNIASKHWQENWENHIKLLEDSKFGRIYMTTVSDYKNPLKPSVSRLNLKISLLVHIAWISVSIIYGKSLLEQNSVISYATWLISLFVVVLLYSSEIRSLKEIWNFVELLFLNKRYDKLFVKSGKIENIKINK